MSTIKLRGMIMNGTKDTIMSSIGNGGRDQIENKIDIVLDRLNQVTDRLSEIEMILNNPMHGIDMPEGVGMSIDPTGVSFDGHYVDSDGNNLAFTTGYDVTSVDVKFDSLIDLDEGIQLNLNLDGDNK